MISGVNVTGIRPIQHHLYLNLENNNFEVWELSTLLSTKLCFFLGSQIFFLLMYLNHKLYRRESRSTRHKIKSKYAKRRKNTKAKNGKSKIDFKKFIRKLFVITLFKCLLMAIIFLAIKQKQSPNQKNKFFIKGYFLSVEHYRDCYHLSKLQIKSNMEWYAMSKLKLKNFNSYFQMLLMLSGDIAINPSPTIDPTLTNPTSIANNELPFTTSTKSSMIT